MFSDNKIQEVKTFLETAPPEAKIFIGCDSQRHRTPAGVWVASYTSVVVVHIRDENGIGHGGVVFAETERQEDYDQVKNRPFMRMMNEAYKATELYQQLEEELLEFEVEIHLDINKDARHGSNVAHSAAVGYAKGITGRDVLTKPEAWAATHVADHGVRQKFGKPPAPYN